MPLRLRLAREIIADALPDLPDVQRPTLERIMAEIDQVAQAIAPSEPHHRPTSWEMQLADRLRMIARSLEDRRND